MLRALSLSLAAGFVAAGCGTMIPTAAPDAAAATSAPTAALPPVAAAPVVATARVTTVAATPTSTPPQAIAAPAFGIEFIDTRLSAAGSVVDLRYRVLDPDKAAPLLDRKIRPVLVHLESGRRYYVPQPPIVGALRQTTRGNQMPQPGRTYFMLFANPDRVLKTGDTLALFVGDQRVGEFRILQ